MLPENKASTVQEYAQESGYKQSPTQDQIKAGVVPLDTLPAQWWNFLWNQMTTQHNLSVTTVTSILRELQHVLTLAGIEPDEATETQLAEAIKKLTSDVIGDLANLKFDIDGANTVVGALNALYDVIIDDIGQKVETLEQDLADAKTELTDAIDAEATARENADDGLNTRVTAIEGKIPDAASSTNKLTDEAFVLRHVATNTANFRGEWPNWADVPTEGIQYPVDYAGNHNPTENDYMVVRDASDYEDKSQEMPSKWEEKDWGTNPPVITNGVAGQKTIWHDKEGNTYNTFSERVTDAQEATHQLVNGEWVLKQWDSGSPYIPVDGACIFLDREGNCHYLGDAYRIIDGNGVSVAFGVPLKLVNNMWVSDEGGIADIPDTSDTRSGAYVWSDNSGNLYYNNPSPNPPVSLQLVEGQWVSKSWPGNRRPYLPDNVWRDNNGNLYCNDTMSPFYTSYQFIDGTWVSKDWGSGVPHFEGCNVWHDKAGNTYLSLGNVQLQLVNGEWVPKSWDTFSSYGAFIWNDGNGNAYFSYENTQLQLIPEHTEAYFKGAWQFKYTGDWATKGKDGWEPEFSLGSLVDTDELDQRYQTLEKAAVQDEQIEANKTAITRAITHATGAYVGAGKQSCIVTLAIDPAVIAETTSVSMLVSWRNGDTAVVTIGITDSGNVNSLTCMWVTRHTLPQNDVMGVNILKGGTLIELVLSLNQYSIIQVTPFFPVSEVIIHYTSTMPTLDFSNVTTIDPSASSFNLNEQKTWANNTTDATHWFTLSSNAASGDVYVAQASVPNHSIEFGIGSGHVNKGMYINEPSLSAWLMRSDGQGHAVTDMSKGFKSPNGIIIPTSQPSNLEHGSIWVV